MRFSVDCFAKLVEFCVTHRALGDLYTDKLSFRYTDATKLKFIVQSQIMAEYCVSMEMIGYEFMNERIDTDRNKNMDKLVIFFIPIWPLWFGRDGKFTQTSWEHGFRCALANRLISKHYTQSIPIGFPMPDESKSISQNLCSILLGFILSFSEYSLADAKLRLRLL